MGGVVRTRDSRGVASLVLLAGALLLYAGAGWCQAPPYDLRPVAEFEEHEGMIIGWYALGSYGAQGDTMWAEAVAAVRQVAIAYIGVHSSGAIAPIQSFLTSLGIPLTNVQFLVGNMVGVWVRDYGPEFCYNENGHRVIVEGGYNHPYNQWLAGLWGLEYYEFPLLMCGGNYMADGAREVANSEAGVGSPAAYHQAIREYYDVPFHIVPKLQGEPCGHIDMYARFVAPNKIVIAQYMDPYYNDNMQEAATQFEAMGFEVFRVTTPVPALEALPQAALEDPSLLHLPPGAEAPRDGMRTTYRTYTNGIQCNGLYLMPTYNHAFDQAALAVFQQALPDHQIIPIKCTTIINYGGALHCTSSDVPADPTARPASLTVAAIGDDVQLDWWPVLGAFSYQVFRRSEPMGYVEGLGDWVAEVAGTSWLDAGALTGTHHAVYQVLALSGTGVRSTFTTREGAVSFPCEAGGP
jgi:agmatine deiminase